MSNIILLGLTSLTGNLYYGLLRVKVKRSSTLTRKIAGWVNAINKVIKLLVGLRVFVKIAGSSNGRTPDFGSGYEGPNPSPAAA